MMPFEGSWSELSDDAFDKMGLLLGFKIRNVGLSEDAYQLCFK